MKYQKKYFIIGLLILIFIALLILLMRIQNETNKNKICFSEKCVDVEIADEYSERQIGLMFREELPENSGMLFIFENSDNYGFWMKNTLVPLDMIWISEDMWVVDVKTATPCVAEPCEIYTPKEEALYVLEVNAGWTEENGIEIGDGVKF